MQIGTTVFFTDIAGFSRLPMDRQSDVIQGLNGVISYELRDLLLPPDGQPQVIALPTGDGAAIAFLSGKQGVAPDFDRILRIAVRLMQWAYDSDTSIRIGVNDGLVSLVTDINGRPNVCGDTINLAQRVMDAANSRQMLISSSSFHQYVGANSPSRELSYGTTQYRFEFDGPYELAAKHGRRISVYKAMLRPSGGNGNGAPEFPWWSNVDPIIRPEAPPPTSAPLTGESLAEKATVAPIDTLASLSDLPTEILDKLKAAFDLRSAATKATDPAADRFAEAAAAFRKITEAHVDYLRSGAGPAKRLNYWLLMERAFCLFRKGDEGDMDEAVRIYEQVEALYPDSAVALFRHGQMLAHRGQLGDAIDKLRTSIALLEEQRKRAQSDLPPVHAVDDRHWVHATARRDLGYYCWLRSKGRPDTESGRRLRRADMKEAIVWTRDALVPVDKQIEDRDAERAKIVNNLVFYGWLERQIGYEGADPVLPEADFERYLATLKDDCAASPTTGFGRWDTLCRALEATGDMAGARVAAAKVKELLRESVLRRMGGDPPAGSAQSDEWMGTDATTHLTPDEVGALFYAAKVLIRS